MRGCRPLTQEEIVRVTDAFRGRHALRDRAFFVLGLKTGLRCRELLGLQLGDLWNGRVLDRVQVRRRITKGRRAGFSLPIHPAAVAALKVHIQHNCRNAELDHPLFQSAKRLSASPRPLDRSAAWRRLKLAFWYAGVHGGTGTHSMRKTYCQNIYRALGHDLLRTQAAMHHRSISSTLRYLSFDQSDVDRAIIAA